LNAYANGAKPMNDVYKSTGSGYAKRIDFTDTERALIAEVALKLTTDEATN
jgi:hypothetical protein